MDDNMHGEGLVSMNCNCILFKEAAAGEQSSLPENYTELNVDLADHIYTRKGRWQNNQHTEWLEEL